MNLVFAASVLASVPAFRDGELAALAPRNRLFAWRDDGSPAPADLGATFRDGIIEGDLAAWLRVRGISPDETALVGDREGHAEAARAASLPCFLLVGDAGTARRLRSEGRENVFADAAALVDAVWKINAVERRLFPLVTVGALVLDDAGDALFVRTRKWSGKWGIPGGKVDYGESLEQALRRELREETGLELGEVRFALTQEAVEHPEFFRPRHFVLMNYLARAAGRAPEVRLNHEGVESAWEAPAAALAGRDLNGPTRVLVEHALRKGERAWAS